MEKMINYGDRVQFSLTCGGPQPSYQVVNALGKKMAFDRNHHLMHPQEGDFAGPNTTGLITLEQVKSAISGVGIRPSMQSRNVRVARTGSSSRTTAVKLNDQFATQRYEYFRNNRQSLPPTISEHSDEITELMKQGKSVEAAFDEVIKKYF